MKIEKYALGSLGTNCYLVENEETKELVIIDPGDLSGLYDQLCETNRL